MEQSDFKTFAGYMAQLAEVYQVQLSQGQLDGYWLGLRDLPLADVKAGMLEAFRTCTFFPKPAEIRKVAYSGEGQALQLPPPERPALTGQVDQLSDPETAKENLERIHALIDSIPGPMPKVQVTDPEDPVFAAALAHGKTMLDVAELDRQIAEHNKQARKRFAKKVAEAKSY